jgi:hypothetical protein
MAKINTSNIPNRDGKEKRVKTDYDTNDIIKVIIEMDKQNDKRFCDFAKQFSRDRKGLKKLWNFVRYDIRYKEDPNGAQLVKTPAALWQTKVGDCKSKTLFVNQVLRCLNIPYIIRFTSYGADPNPTHVYSIAILDGQQIKMDTVYHMFNSEKPYRHKKDFFVDMKGLYKISGVDSTPDVAKRLKEIKEKQAALPQEEFIPFSKLTAGEAQLMLMKRALDIKSVMKPQNAKVYKEAKQVVDAELAAMKRGKFHQKGFAKLGSFSNAITPVLQKLQYIKSKQQPAMQKPYMLAPQPKRAAGIRGTWIDGNTYQKTDGTEISLPVNPSAIPANLLSATDSGNQDIPYLFDANGTYIFGKNSQYRKELTTDIDGRTLWQVYGDLVEQYINTKFKDGNSIITAPYTIPTQTATGIQQMPVTFSKIRAPRLSEWQVCKQNPTLLQTNSTCNLLTFANAATRTEFIYDLRAASGIMDEYMNDTFKDANQLGNGFIYGFLNDAGLNLNNVPPAVAAKYATHAGYISGAASFSGLDDAIIKDLGANNIMFTNDGDSPETILQALKQQNEILRGQASAVGIDPITIISAITAAIIAIVGAIEAVMQTAKRESDLIDPTNLPDTFKPIGAPLMLSQDDWTGTGSGGNNNGNGGGSGSGINPGLMVAGAGVAWYLYNQSK